MEYFFGFQEWRVYVLKFVVRRENWGVLKVQAESGIIIWNQLIIKNTFKTFEELQVEYNCSTAEESYIQLWHYYFGPNALQNTLDFECFREGSFSPKPTIKFY